MPTESDLTFQPETYWDDRDVLEGDGGSQGAEPMEWAGMVGGFLPPILEGEVEIALITMLSTLGDVISIRARQDGDVIRYTVVDEYEDERDGEPGYEFSPQQSSQPLTFRELTDLIWSLNPSEYGNFFEVSWIEDDQINYCNDDPNDFFFFSSEFYSGLQEWFEGKFMEMKLEKREEYCED